jgi:hypothetical protein
MRRIVRPGYPWSSARSREDRVAMSDRYQNRMGRARAGILLLLAGLLVASILSLAAAPGVSPSTAGRSTVSHLAAAALFDGDGLSHDGQCPGDSGAADYHHCGSSPASSGSAILGSVALTARSRSGAVIARAEPVPPVCTSHPKASLRSQSPALEIGRPSGGWDGSGTSAPEPREWTPGEEFRS